MRKIDFTEIMELLALGGIDCNEEEVPHLYSLKNCLQKTTTSLAQKQECCHAESEPLPKVNQVKECWPHYEALRNITPYDSRYHERIYAAVNSEFELIPIGKIKLIPQPHELLHLVNTKHKFSELTKEEKDQLHLLASRKAAMDGACCQSRKQWEGELQSVYKLLVDSLNDTSSLVLSLKKAEDVDTLYFYLGDTHLKTL